jgi:hypothetical protein
VPDGIEDIAVNITVKTWLFGAYFPAGGQKMI